MERRRGKRIAAKKKPLIVWAIEFSKRLVVVCVLMHVGVFIFTAVAVWHLGDTSTLSTIITESSDILKTCVFGYLAKAGLENLLKIKKNAPSEMAAQEENAEEMEVGKG